MSRLFAIVATAALVTAAHAAPPPVFYSTHHVSVAYDDLDLRSDVGARIMLLRINRAADEVCGGRPDLHRNFYGTRELRVLMPIYAKCRTDAVSKAVASLDAPAVAKAYAQSRNAPDRLAGR
jgi:UrcA family protein